MESKFLIVAGMYVVFAAAVLALSARKRKRTGDKPTTRKVAEVLMVGAIGCGVLLYSAI